MPEDPPGTSEGLTVSGPAPQTGGDCYLACFPARPIRLSRQRPTTIGRADGNTIVLADGQVSRHHAIVEWKDGHFAVRDARSRNGVFVNDARLAEGEQRQLHPDDRVGIGERVFTFLEGDEHAVRRLFLHQRREKHSGVTDVIRAASLKRPAHALSGSLADFGLAELLQALELGRKTGKVAITCESGRGEILLRDGQLVGAALGELADKEALFAMLALETGEFEYEARPVDGDREVLAGTAGLLMEAFRRLDEEHRTDAEGPQAGEEPEGRPEEQAASETHDDGGSGPAADGPREGAEDGALDPSEDTVAPEGG
jgi:pSer/pThr/pTyr-binding forkhead associated (FHA) protein